MAGMLIEKYPDDEVDIVKSIYNFDYSNAEVGEKALEKFGYGLENKMSNDKNFGIYLKSFLKNQFLFFNNVYSRYRNNILFYKIHKQKIKQDLFYSGANGTRKLFKRR